MPAESRRAAVLDGAHDFQLGEAHMAGVGATQQKSRKMSATSRAGRDMLAGSYAGGLVPVGSKRSEAI